VFDKCWLYIGHESEVRTQATSAREPVAGAADFWVRGDDSVAAALLNTCTHRDSLVATEIRQRADVSMSLPCMTYNSRGQLGPACLARTHIARHQAR